MLGTATIKKVDHNYYALGNIIDIKYIKFEKKPVGLAAKIFFYYKRKPHTESVDFEWGDQNTKKSRPFLSQPVDRRFFYPYNLGINIF